MITIPQMKDHLVKSLSLLLAPLLFSLPSSAEQKSELPLPTLSKTVITTNIKSIKDKRTAGRPLSNITDDDSNSFYWSGAQLRKNHMINFTFDQPVPLNKRLKIYTGFAVKNHEDGDMLTDAVLEASKDSGKTWIQVSQFHSGNVELIPTFLTTHYRIRVTKTDILWGAIRHLSITDKPLSQKTIKSKVNYNNKVYQLSVSTDFDLASGAADPRLYKGFEAMAKLYFEVWAKQVQWLNADPTKIPRDIDISFVSTLTHPAHARGHTMTMLIKHLLDHPDDIEGVFVHELAHIVQAYSTYDPIWFVEGSADYVRYRQFPNKRWANSARKHMNNTKPLGLYWNSACFLLWMEDTYKKPITATISRAIYERRYKESLFKDLTGKSLAELIAAYKSSSYRPALQSPILP